jgi:hypothetical protein
MKTATSLTLVAVGAIIAFAITAHITFLNLQVTGWVLILTGVAGATSTWLRRTLVVKRRASAAAPDRTGQRPPPSQRPVPRWQPATAPDATPAEPETIEEYAGV